MTDTKEQVHKLLSRGYTPRDIALHLGISTQRVYQHMEVLRREGEKKKKTAT